MTRLLLLTKNILSEEDFIGKLKHLNYEVLCSVSIVELLIDSDEHIPNFVKCFPVVIIDETISNYEMKKIVSTLKNNKHIILREIKDLLDEDENCKLKELGIDGLLYSNEPVCSLREQLSKFTYQFHDILFELKKNEVSVLDSNGSHSIFKLLTLSKLEKRLLNKLLANPGEIITREELCIELWGSISNSRLSQLSSLVARIRLKLEEVFGNETVIQTIWKRGYRFMKDLKI